jgi:hypothetical protein
MHIGGTSLYIPSPFFSYLALPLNHVPLICVIDARNPPPSGRIPTPHDIIASIYVKDGKVRSVLTPQFQRALLTLCIEKIMPETYEPQPMYRVCTQDGVCILPYGLDEYVLERLQAVADEE